MDTSKHYKYKYSIFAVIEELHMACNGSADYLTDEELLEMSTWLSYRLDNWIPSSSSTLEYDEQVRRLASIACDETLDYLIKLKG